MKRNRSFLALSASFLAAAVFFWCGCSAPEAKSAPLSMMLWHPADAPQEVQFELVDGNRAVGCCGDNRFFGPIRIEGNAEAGQLRFGPVGVTQRRGSHEKYEKKFLDTLPRVRYYVYEKETLTLYDEEFRALMILSGRRIPAPK